MVKVLTAGVQLPAGERGCWQWGGGRGAEHSPHSHLLLTERWKVSALQVSIAGRWSAGKVFVLSRPGLDLLPLLPLGFALGSAFSFAVQALDQLLDNGVGRRGADFLVLLGGEHNSTQHASRFGALDAVGLHPLDGDGLLAGLQAAV